MNDLSPIELVRQIHDAPSRIVLAITGGGSRAIAELLEEPGGSRVLLEAVVPYSPAALRGWLGGPPEQYSSSRTARAMAMAAWRRAGELDASEALPTRPTLIGVACTASLASDRPKLGPHRLHVAWQTESASVSHSLELVKGHRTRREEEELTTQVLLNAIAEACGISSRLAVSLTGSEQFHTERCDAPIEWRDLLTAKTEKVVHRNGAIATTTATAPAPPGCRAIFSGAFNPLHEGHRRIAELATAILKTPIEFEISVLNVDKPPLDFIEMRSRFAQFDSGQTVWFTRAATFERKAELFEQTTFIVGADTIIRIADPRYYGGDPAALAASIARLTAHGARFLVFGRSMRDRFKALRDLPLPPALAAICDEVPAEQFQVDISSSQLRHGSHN